MRKAALLSLAMLASACGPKFAGDYEGEASVKIETTPTPFEANKVPVQVTIGPGGKTFELKGGPFVSCSPKAESSPRQKGMILDLTGGSCTVKTASGPLALAPGAAIASWEGNDTWSIDFLSPTDVKPRTTLEVRAHRRK